MLDLGLVISTPCSLGNHFFLLVSVKDYFTINSIIWSYQYDISSGLQLAWVLFHCYLQFKKKETNIDKQTRTHMTQKVFSSESVLLWWSGNHFGIILVNKVRSDALRWLTSCRHYFRGLQCWKNLVMIPPVVECSKKGFDRIRIAFLKDFTFWIHKKKNFMHLFGHASDKYKYIKLRVRPPLSIFT